MIIKIRNHIFTGLLIILPLMVSIIITIWLFKFMTDWVINLISPTLKIGLVFQIIIRIIIIVTLLAILAFIGMLTRAVFIKNIFSTIERLLIKIPLFNKIYISVKQLSNSFLGQDKDTFRKVVLVEYPRKGLYSLGFITVKASKELEKSIRHEAVNVFIPTVPNPTGGMLIAIKPSEIAETDIDVENGLKFVISLGTIPLAKKSTNNYA